MRETQVFHVTPTTDRRERQKGYHNTLALFFSFDIKILQDVFVKHNGPAPTRLRLSDSKDWGQCHNQVSIDVVWKCVTWGACMPNINTVPWIDQKLETILKFADRRTEKRVNTQTHECTYARTYTPNNVSQSLDPWVIKHQIKYSSYRTQAFFKIKFNTFCALQITCYFLFLW